MLRFFGGLSIGEWRMVVANTFAYRCTDQKRLIGEVSDLPVDYSQFPEVFCRGCRGLATLILRQLFLAASPLSIRFATMGVVSSLAI